MNVPPLVIFDLDGTLSDATHRQHLVQGGKRDWHGFFQACDQDFPKPATIAVARSLHALGHELWLFSGRSDEVLGRTLQWLNANKLGGIFSRKSFRRHGDYTPDHELKKKWYDEMSPENKARLLLVFDDRDRLVKMWRDLGVTCFQVAPGDF